MSHLVLAAVQLRNRLTYIQSFYINYNLSMRLLLTLLDQTIQF